MIVDPVTGQVLGLSSTAQAGGDPLGVQGNARATAAGAIGNAAGIEGGRFADSLTHIPGVIQAGFYNARRIQNTILRGPSQRNVTGLPGHRRTFSRFGSWSQLGGASIGGDAPWYTPGSLEKFGNWAGNRITGGRSADAGATQYFNRGFFGRMSTASRIYQSNPRPGAMIPRGLPASPQRALPSPAPTRGPRALPRGAGLPAVADSGAAAVMAPSADIVDATRAIGQFVQHTDEPLAAAVRSQMASGADFMMDTTRAKNYLGDLVSMTNHGRISQYVGGYLSGANHRIGIESIETALEAGRNRWIAGANTAADHLNLGGIKPGERVTMSRAAQGFRNIWADDAARAGARTASSIIPKLGMSAKFGTALAAKAGLATVPVVGQAIAAAWTAYDMASLGINAGFAAVDFGKEAFKSFKGSIDKPIMGAGYQDTAVAATSRARGVAAIQNSRLNARSVLGSESSYLHQHFG